MGRHSKVQPKKISLLTTIGGLFATVLLAAGLFGVSSLIHHEPKAQAPEHMQVPKQTTTVATSNIVDSKTVVPTQNNISTSIQNVPPIIIDVPGSKQSPVPPAQAPRVDVTIAATVADVPVGVDIAADTAVPLLSAVTDTVTDALEDITDPIINLLDK